jgi:hypoxanthine phosphoribosyltransferase
MKVLIAESEVRAGVQQLARKIEALQAGRPLTIVAVMTGSLVLLADLMRHLQFPLRIGVVQASSYRQATTAGELSVNPFMLPSLEGEDVLLLDDIFDTGQTLVAIREALSACRPAGITTAVLLEKRGRARVELRPDLVVFQIPDCFVVGYGLDYKDLYRNLPYLAELEASDLTGGSVDVG